MFSRILAIFLCSLLILFFQNCSNLKSNNLQSVNLESHSGSSPSHLNEPGLSLTDKTQNPFDGKPRVLSLKLVHNEDPTKSVTLSNNKVIDPNFFPNGNIRLEISVNENVKSIQIRTNGLSDVDSSKPFTSAANFNFDENSAYNIEIHPFTKEKRKGVRGDPYKLRFLTMKYNANKPTFPTNGHWNMTTPTPKSNLTKTYRPIKLKAVWHHLCRLRHLFFES